MPDPGAGIPGDDVVCPQCGTELDLYGRCKWEGCAEGMTRECVYEYEEPDDEPEPGRGEHD